MMSLPEPILKRTRRHSSKQTVSLWGAGMLPTLLLLLPLLWRGTLAQNRIPQLELQESVILQEGLCVLVLCKFSPPWPHYLPASNLYWFQKEAHGKYGLPVATNKEGAKLKKGAQGRFLLLGDPWNNCSLTIRDANMADSGTYVFHVKRHHREHTYEDKLLSVKVTALSQLPNIQVPDILESGNPRNLSCTVAWACEQGTPPIFSWNSAALTSVGPRTHLSSVLTISPRPQDHGTSLTCQVTFPAVDVTIKRTVRLNVSSLKTLENASSVTVLEGQYLRLHCVADSNPPARLSWFRGFPSADTSPISTGYAELSQVVTGEGRVFTCQAQNHLGSQQVFLNVSIYCEFGGTLGKGSMELERLVEGHQHPFATNVASDGPAPAVTDRLSTEEEALHYASISFDRLKRKEREDTDYSEIRAPK
ncbi:sialic acid-binding Ig-like lectin 6 [Echinops telfairi]|uniref:Sialic acid-binding Ig-like lectin 6 n=1 Tax=Echinops telfairi TaxID=9371 RepID=A0AC55D9D6_ECHTE|nr:sialic acid-binding Ig-like lectin 6 [Echinops telfairi]